MRWCTLVSVLLAAETSALAFPPAVSFCKRRPADAGRKRLLGKRGTVFASSLEDSADNERRKKPTGAGLSVDAPEKYNVGKENDPRHWFAKLKRLTVALLLGLRRSLDARRWRAALTPGLNRVSGLFPGLTGWRRTVAANAAMMVVAGTVMGAVAPKPPKPVEVRGHPAPLSCVAVTFTAPDPRVAFLVAWTFTTPDPRVAFLFCNVIYRP